MVENTVYGVIPDTHHFWKNSVFCCVFHFSSTSLTTYLFQIMLLKLPSSVIVLIGTGTSVFLSSFLLILSDLYGFVLSEYLLLTQGCGVFVCVCWGFFNFSCAWLFPVFSRLLPTKGSLLTSETSASSKASCSSLIFALYALHWIFDLLWSMDVVLAIFE